MKHYLSSLALALLLAGGVTVAALAQTETSASEDASAPATEQAQAEDDEAPPVDVEPAEPLLGDYEASEQISEDLSVSFPVDI